MKAKLIETSNEKMKKAIGITADFLYENSVFRFGEIKTSMYTILIKNGYKVNVFTRKSKYTFEILDH